MLASVTGEVLKFKVKIGSTGLEDRIIECRFLENDRRILLIGAKNLQICDIENAGLPNSVPHDIPQFAPKGIGKVVTVRYSL